jgi:glutaredoxin-like protein NrdH
VTYNVLGTWAAGQEHDKGEALRAEHCPRCRRLKAFLDEHGVQYEDIEVDLLEGGEQWVASRELKRYNPAATYPTLVVEEVIVDFDEKRLKEALGLE